MIENEVHLEVTYSLFLTYNPDRIIGEIENQAKSSNLVRIMTVDAKHLVGIYEISTV